MTRWGLLLLVGFIVLGLSRSEHDVAAKRAVWGAAIVLSLVGLRVGLL
jgi:hypothetical protein